jgi:hypothetical protein
VTLIESCIPIVEQFISHEYRLLNAFLDNFNLPIRLSLEGVDVTVGPHKWEKGSQLIEKDVELVCGLPIETWNVGTHEAQT